MAVSVSAFVLDYFIDGLHFCIIGELFVLLRITYGTCSVAARGSPLSTG